MPRAALLVSSQRQDDQSHLKLRPENTGGLDPTFNSTGEKEIAISPNNGSTSSHDQANAIAIQSDGKIILAGYARADINPSSSPEQFAIVRLNPDGSQDTGFGIFGIVTTQVSSSAFAPNSRAQAVTGKGIARSSPVSPVSTHRSRIPILLWCKLRPEKHILSLLASQ
jgi:uncharacterized delta-60 repeat protein